MITFRPYKHPFKKLFLSGRFRKMRQLDNINVRRIQNWLKRTDKWK
jgi:hypothetical protein